MLISNFLQLRSINGQAASPSILCGILWSVAIEELKLGKPKAKLNPRKRKNKRSIWGARFLVRGLEWHPFEDVICLLVSAEF